jgi:hypothetical protein
MMTGRAVGMAVDSITNLAIDLLCGYTAEGLAATFALIAIGKVTETAA